MPHTNVIENLKQTKKLYDKDEFAAQIAIPRPPPKELGGRSKLRTPWKYSTSVFRDYRTDVSKTLDAAFEADWDNSKLPRYIKDEDEKAGIKKLLHSKYALFRESYKFMSGVDP